MPLTVTPAAGDVSLSVAVRFAGGPRRSFVVDTGSSQSVVSTSVARAAVAGGHRAGAAPGDGVLGHHRPARAQRAVVGARACRSTPSSSGTDFGTISLGGTQGLLGSDQLKRYGWVVFDYTGGRLVLG